MLEIQISRHCLEQILARQWDVKEKRAKLRRKSEGYIYLFFFRWSQMMTEEMTFQVSLENCQGFSILWEVHSTSQERWMKMFWKVILSLSVMAPRGDARSQISDSWRDVDCYKWVEEGGCWACGCSICKHQCLELDASVTVHTGIQEQGDEDNINSRLY